MCVLSFIRFHTCFLLLVLFWVIFELRMVWCQIDVKILIQIVLILLRQQVSSSSTELCKNNVPMKILKLILKKKQLLKLTHLLIICECCWDFSAVRSRFWILVCSPCLPLLSLSLTSLISAELNNIDGKVVDAAYFQMYAMESRDHIVISFGHCQHSMNKVHHLRVLLQECKHSLFR